MDPKQLARTRKQTLAQGGQHDGAVITLEQATARHCFKPLNLNADRRRTFVEPFGRSPEPPQPGDHVEAAQKVEVEHRRHDQIFPNMMIKSSRFSE
jgi:hypothetical protein